MLGPLNISRWLHAGSNLVQNKAKRERGKSVEFSTISARILIVVPFLFRFQLFNVRFYFCLRFENNFRLSFSRARDVARATGNSRFESDKFPVLVWKNPENSRLELMTFLQANTFIIARKWPKLTHFYQFNKTQ